MNRRRFARYAAPAAFLAAVTIAVLLVRAGLRQGRPHHTRPPATTTTTTPRRHHHGKKPHRARTYVVQSGDTLDSIARKFGTTVARLEQLNPKVNPTALQVGERIRVQ